MNKNEKTNGLNKIEDIVNQYVKKIYELDKSSKTLDDKIKQIDNLTDNLIDYCIKKKIFYYVENKISYNQIMLNFKNHLIGFIKNLVDPTNTIIDKYIINSKNQYGKNDDININSNWDNVSDINSLMLKNFKDLNESFDKNVSFDNNIQITNYDDFSEGFEFNYNSTQTKSKNSNDIPINFNLVKLAEYENKSDTNNEMSSGSLSLYIKILVNQNKYLVEFISKLISMCKILSDQECKYKKSNPYE